MIVMPGWAYDHLERQGHDMSGYIRAEHYDPQPKEKVVRYLNRESRRKAQRARRKK